jgi:hypothetical protein
LPHAPQFAASLASNTQVAPQRVSTALHSLDICTLPPL